MTITHEQALALIETIAEQRSPSSDVSAVTKEQLDKLREYIKTHQNAEENASYRLSSIRSNY